MLRYHPRLPELGRIEVPRSEIAYQPHELHAHLLHFDQPVYLLNSPNGLGTWIPSQTTSEDQLTQIMIGALPVQSPSLLGLPHAFATLPQALAAGAVVGASGLNRF